MDEVIILGLVLVLALGAYWSLVIFPKQRDFPKRVKYVSALKQGDEMITYGGIIGKVVTVEPEKGIAHIEIADGVIVRVIMPAVMAPFNPEEMAADMQQTLNTRETRSGQ